MTNRPSCWGPTLCVHSTFCFSFLHLKTAPIFLGKIWSPLLVLWLASFPWLSVSPQINSKLLNVIYEALPTAPPSHFWSSQAIMLSLQFPLWPLGLCRQSVCRNAIPFPLPLPVSFSWLPPRSFLLRSTGICIRSSSSMLWHLWYSHSPATFWHQWQVLCLWTSCAFFSLIPQSLEWCLE